MSITVQKHGMYAMRLSLLVLQFVIRNIKKQKGDAEHQAYKYFSVGHDAI